MTDPDDVLGQLPRLSRHLEVDLSDRDVERLVRGGAELRQRRRLRRSLVVGLALGAVSAIVVVFILRVSKGTPHAVVSVQQPFASATASGAKSAIFAHAPQALTLRDDSKAIPLDSGEDLAIEMDTPDRVELRLDRGRARFEVTRRPSRTFSVRAGNVTVRVIGTTFDVEVVADRVGVAVQEGTVEVDWGVGRKKLVAGDRGWFPPLVMSGHAEASGDVAGTSAATPTKRSQVESDADSQRAENGSAQALLEEVDVARSQGRPDVAVGLLRRILREHPHDPRAPLAAFTLGRVLLNELGRPREAAAAFHEVRQKAPAGQFAEDALAREVDAWSAASEPSRARTLAEAYLERYPGGRHARRMKALAGE
jgi:transmembrane sensor